MKKVSALFIMATLVVFHIFSVYADVPKVEAQGSVIMDFKTGRVLWGQNENKKLAMASTTKIMTAIIALENGNLKDVVTVSRKASLTPPVKMNLSTGQKIRLEDLLYALMLQSSNDAAVAIAEHIGGSVPEFCKMMTEKAKEIGANNTSFETPNGLDGENHYSTAYDMALITRYALNNKDFVKIINTREIDLPVSGGKFTNYHVINKNRLLSEFKGANGVKTGYTGKAGHCFVGAAEQNGMELITVVLASGWGTKGKQQKWVDTKRLLNFGFDNFKYENIVEQGNIAKQISVNHSKTSNITAYFKNNVEVPLSEEELKTVKIDILAPDLLEAPINVGDKIGVGQVFIDNDLFCEVDLLAKEGATRHDFKTSIEKIINGMTDLFF